MVKPDSLSIHSIIEGDVEREIEAEGYIHSVAAASRNCEDIEV